MEVAHFHYYISSIILSSFWILITNYFELLVRGRMSNCVWIQIWWTLLLIVIIKYDKTFNVRFYFLFRLLHLNDPYRSHFTFHIHLQRITFCSIRLTVIALIVVVDVACHVFFSFCCAKEHNICIIIIIFRRTHELGKKWPMFTQCSVNVRCSDECLCAKILFGFIFCIVLIRYLFIWWTAFATCRKYSSFSFMP